MGFSKIIDIANLDILSPFVPSRVDGVGEVARYGWVHGGTSIRLCTEDEFGNRQTLVRGETDGKRYQVMRDQSRGGIDCDKGSSHIDHERHGRPWSMVGGTPKEPTQGRHCQRG